MTPRQRAILSYIESYYAERGLPPSCREICAACDVSSTSVTQYNCWRLADQGHLVKVGHGLSRSFVPAAAVEELTRLRTEMDRLRHENGELRAQLALMPVIRPDPVFYTSSTTHATPTREPCVRCGKPLDTLTGWYVVAGGAVCGGCLGAGEPVRAQAR